MSEEDDEEKVCLNGTQMKNIIEAARADESGDPDRLRKVCPKAKKFVQGYHPKKENDPVEKTVSKAARKAESKVKRVIKEKLGALGDLF